MAEDEVIRLERRLRRLPEAIRCTERKLARLYREATEYRAYDLLNNPALVDAVLESEAARAKMISKMDPLRVDTGE